MGKIVAAVCILPFIALQCTSTTQVHDEIVEGLGTVVYLDFEGGFYGIIGDDGGHYDPINLPFSYKIDGLRVIFQAKTRDDLVSYHMWGAIVELIFIAKL